MWQPVAGNLEGGEWREEGGAVVTAGRQPDLCHQGFEVPSPLEVVGHVEGEGGVEVGSQGERGRASGQEGDRCLQGASFELLLKILLMVTPFRLLLLGYRKCRY